MKSHPAYTERSQDTSDAPRDVPYVPFGVGELSGWTANDIRNLPPIGCLDDGFKVAICYRLVDYDLDGLKEKLADWCLDGDVYGFGFADEMVTVFRV